LKSGDLLVYLHFIFTVCIYFVFFCFFPS